MASGMMDFGVTFIGRILGIVLTVASQSILAWGLGLEGRGAYAICILVPTFLTLIFMLGCDVAVQYEVASKRQSLSQGVMHITLYGLVASVAAIAVGVACVHLRVPVFTKVSPREMYLALAMIPMSFFLQSLVALLISIQEFACSAVFSIIGGVLQVILTVLFVLLLGWHVEGAVLSLLVGNFLVSASVIGVMRKRYGLVLARPDFAMIRDMLHYGLRYYLGKLSNMANAQVGTILLALFADKAEIGLFAVASQVTTRVMMVPDALMTVLIPRAATDSDGRQELVAQGSRVCFFICGAMLAVLALFARPLVCALFSPAFLGSVPLIRILALGVLLRCAAKIYVPYLLGTNRPGIVSFAVGTGALINLGLVLLLLPTIGLAGAAIAMGVSYVISSTILTMMFHRFSGLGYWEIARPRKSDWDPLRRVWVRLRGRDSGPAVQSPSSSSQDIEGQGHRLP